MMSQPRPRASHSIALVLAMMTPATAQPAPPAPSLSASASAAVPPRQPDGAELLRAIERLGVVGRVLYVAAHPDDENTRFLAWLANDRLVRAAYLSVTRGDGGQNLIGAEQGPLLGLIRTQELLGARSVDGAEQLFTRARDFGYSKNPQETLAIWGRDAVLADVVWAIRTFRPDVVITRFPIKGMETHGHHTASAMLAVEALAVAGDPGYHPEQVKLAGAFAPRRVVWNKSAFFVQPGEDLSAFAKLDTGAYNAALGTSYGELAARSRSMHKSQGFGAAAARGSSLEYFQLLGGEPFAADPLEGVDLTWRRVPGGEAIIPLVERARAAFRADRPWEVVPSLLELRAAIAGLADNPFGSEKLAAIDQLVVDCSGLFLEATAPEFAVTPGASLPVTVSILPRTPAAVAVVEARLPGGKALPVAAMPAPNSQPLELKDAIAVPATTPLSNPYWLAQPPERGMYRVDDPLLIGRPESPPALAVELVLRAGATTFSVRRPVLYKWVDPVAGERTRAVEIAPVVTAAADASVLVFPDGKPRPLRVTLKAGRAGLAGALRPAVPPDWRVEPAVQRFAIDDKGGEQEVRFTITPPAAVPAPSRDPFAAPVQVTLSAEVGGGPAVARGLTRIEYPHIPIQTLFPEATVKLVRLDCKRGRTRLGYVAGAGDDVPQALRQVGYEVTMLTGEALSDLSVEQLDARFEALVVGVRAYNTDARLPYLHDKLMEYVKRGGTMVVQYSTANRMSKVPPAIGPYPFAISQERVTDEEAKVNVELPGHALVSKPNAIGPADFAGWVQERGLYFAGKWDDHYDAPLSMHDPFEPARRGGLLAVRHGKGAFVYTGLSFFRQLPAGVPGAFRLFANLIAYGADS